MEQLTSELIYCVRFLLTLSWVIFAILILSLSRQILITFKNRDWTPETDPSQ